MELTMDGLSTGGVFREWRAFGRRLRLIGPLSFALVAGCLPSWGLPSTSNDSEVGMPLAGSPKTLPSPSDGKEDRRSPQPNTCVAFGNLQLDTARDANRSPGQRQESYDTARKYYQQAIKLDERCAEAYHGLAKAYEGMGDHARCVDTLQRARKALPKDGSFPYECGMYHARRKEWPQALENLAKATELSPENRTYSNMRGHCLARMGRYDESIAWFSKTVGEAQAHYNVARMLQHVQQGDACKSHLAKALEINPDHAEAREMYVRMTTGGAADSSVKPAHYETKREFGSTPRSTSN
jgi:tetratricopeptide (TPR) repeat protein